METPQPFATPDFTTAETVPATGWPAPPQPLAPKHGVFVGRFGLRAGWGILIYIVLFLVFTIIVSVGILAAQGKLKPMIAERRAASIAAANAKKNYTAPPAPVKPAAPATSGPPVMKPKGTIINEALTFGVMLAAAALLSVFERRRLAVYGIGRNRLVDFLPGAFWGVAALSLLVLVLKSMHLLFFDGRLLSGGAIFTYGAKWLIAFLFVGFSEEYLMRGYMQFTLTRGMFGLGEKISPVHARAIAFWIGAFIMSLIFGALHLGNGGENALGILQVFIVGMVFSYALWRTGSLWWAIGFHMAWDWAQSFLYGVPDSGNISVGRLFQTHYAGKTILSGGADGPEGSILCVGIFLLMIFVIRFTTKPGPQPTLEQLPDTRPYAEPIVTSPAAV